MVDKYIVAIDSSPINLDVIKKICESKKILVQTAGSGDKGFAQVHELLDQEKVIACILVDNDLPERTVIEFIKKIKADERTKDIHIVVSASAVNKEQVIEARKCGAADFLLKPFSKEMFLERVKSCLGGDINGEE